MKIMYGDILKLCKKGAILQQVNCQCAMGAGLAKNIMIKYPVVRKEYINLSKELKTPNARLGTLQEVVASNDVSVFNSFTQLNFGNAKKTGICYTNESLLVKNIMEFDRICKERNIEGYVPLLIGCELAGGSPEVIKSALEKTDLNVVIYR